MRILVTGVSGFIGTNLAHALRDSGNEVAGIDIRSPSYLDKEICVIEHDLRTPLPTQMLHGVDAVIALAADMGGMGRISRNKGTLMRNNTLIDVNTFEAARNADVRTVVFASSACVYPNFLQVTRGRNLRESDAFPADPQDA